MAFASTSIWEVNAAGADTNGGGFDPSNANMATDLAATSATGTAPVVSSASYTFVAGDVGHYVYVQAGTNWTPGWYLIASVAAGAATLTATIGSVVLAGSGSVNTVAGCATVAAPSGGTWTIDYSQNATPPYSYTDMVIGVTTTTFTSVVHPITASLVGNVINVTSGTGFTVQRVQVVSVNLGSLVATCDKSLGTTASTGGNGTLGGCLASPGLAAGQRVADNYIFIKNTGGGTNTTYDLSASTNVSGGSINDTSAGSARGTFYVGYETTRTINNRDTNFPVLRANANSVTCLRLGANQVHARNLIADNNGAKTGTIGFDLGSTSVRVERCWAKNQTSKGMTNSSSAGMMIDVAADSCAVGLDVGTGTLIGFSVKSATGNGVNCGADGCVMDGVIAGSGSVGLNVTSGRAKINHVTIYGSTSDGVLLGGGVQNIVLKNVASYSNGGRNFNTTTTDLIHHLYNCASGAGGSADNLVARQYEGLITLTGDPFTNAAGGDFTLNNTAGAGAALRATGDPTAYLSYPTITNQFDVGGYQQQGTGASTTTYVLSQRITQLVVDPY